MKLSVVIPVYNEESSIQTTLEELERYMRGYKACSSWEIIAVNDGSSDNTLSALNRMKASAPWLKVVSYNENIGRGKALRCGFDASSGDVIVCLDADLSYAPYHIERMVSKLVDENADIVLASAYGKGGSVENVPLRRLLLSRLGNKVLSYMYRNDVSFLTCIVRAFKKEFIEKLDLHSNDKDIHLEILYKAKILNAKIREVPADLKWRKEKLISPSKRRSTLKLKKTGKSHMFFGLMNNPGFVFIVPANILLAASLYIFALTAKGIIINIVADNISLYNAIRNSMLNAAPSWITSVFCFLLAIQFLSLGFLTNQNKKNYEETYRTLHAILKKVTEK
jgi:glycosyltransferase involved in cell wall biosynthesis